MIQHQGIASESNLLEVLICHNFDFRLKLRCFVMCSVLHRMFLVMNWYAVAAAVAAADVVAAGDAVPKIDLKISNDI